MHLSNQFEFIALTFYEIKVGGSVILLFLHFQNVFIIFYNFFREKKHSYTICIWFISNKMNLNKLKIQIKSINLEFVLLILS